MSRFLFFITISCFLFSCSNKKMERKMEGITVELPILWTADCSPNGKHFAIGGDTVLRIYDAKTHKLHKTYSLRAAIRCLDWNADGELLAIASDENVQLFSIKTEQFSVLKGVAGARALDWNPKGDRLAVGDYEGVLHIFDKTGTPLKFIEKDSAKTYLSVEWHPFEEKILTGTDKIRIFDSEGNLLHSIKHRPEPTIILTTRWHPSGRYFAIGDYGHREENIESILQFWSEEGVLQKTMHGSKAEYRNIRWNMDGTVLASASDALRLWSNNGELLHTGLSKNLLWGLDWMENEERILTSGEQMQVTFWTNKAVIKKD